MCFSHGSMLYFVRMSIRQHLQSAEEKEERRLSAYLMFLIPHWAASVEQRKLRRGSTLCLCQLPKHYPSQEVRNISTSAAHLSTQKGTFFTQGGVFKVQEQWEGNQTASASGFNKVAELVTWKGLSVSFGSMQHLLNRKEGQLSSQWGREH